MTFLGTAMLALGLLLAAYALAGSLLGARLGMRELVVSARRAYYLSAGAALAAAATLVAAFVTHNFDIEYVFSHSNTTMEPGLIWVAFYSGNEGSLLYILSALAGMGVVAVRFLPVGLKPAAPYMILLLGSLQVFYFAVLLGFANPFAPLESAVRPVEGLGINPLLRHPGMFIHPPLLMAGLVGIGVPFALVNGAIMAGLGRDEWLDRARVWGIVVWAVLGLGLIVGAWWAYTILGWGGYWGWDPIENVALMPWLVLTAFIHSIMVQKRRGMFRLWNVALIGIAFVIAQLGLYINRGGPVVSVHSFASSTLGGIFLGFMLVSLLAAVLIFVFNWNRIQSSRRMESLASREASILLNTFLMLVSVVVILWGIIFPVFSDLVRDAEVAVAAPYFNRTVGPILLVTLFAMGVGPLLPWRRSNWRTLRYWFSVPAIVATAVVAVLLAFGVLSPLALLVLWVLGFSLTTVLVEWWRGTRARMRHGARPWRAWLSMVADNRARHGGYIVHISMLVFALGVTGTQFFDVRTDVSLRPGESVVLREYRVEYLEPGSMNHPDHLEQWADLMVYRVDPADYAAERAAAAERGEISFVLDAAEGERAGDVQLEALRPWQEYYPNYNQASVRSAIRSTASEDLYLIPRDFTAQDDRVVLGVSINPLAIWLWLSAPIFVLGTAVALWPGRGERRAGAGDGE